MEIAGVPCMVYAARHPSTSSLKECDFVLYLHGGAFVASMHAADLGPITSWATKCGAVVVVPDYALAPECPYPQVWRCRCGGAGQK